MTVAKHGYTLRRSQIKVAIAVAIDHPTALARHHHRFAATGNNA
jgi:hypothetical protein